MFEWLIDYQKLQDKIDYLEYKIDREKRELKRWTYGDLQNVRLNENSIAAGLEDRIFTMEYELAHLINDLHNAQKLISKFKGIENEILYCRYVKGLSLSEVAGELGYTPGHIYNKHAEIMRKINFAHKLI